MENEMIKARIKRINEINEICKSLGELPPQAIIASKQDGFIDRKDYLLSVVICYLKKYGEDKIFYDETICDGRCLAEDLEKEFLPTQTFGYSEDGYPSCSMQPRQRWKQE